MSVSTSWRARNVRLALACLFSISLSGFLAFGGPAFSADRHGAADRQSQDITESDPAAASAKESELISNVRQLTFDGRRAGEGYFSADGSQLVFQSEREPGNPFFQIYVLDLETGDVEKISPGHGKTTCAWIHPSGNKVLFASTHDDEDAEAKQREEIKLRESGQERRYSWDYDEHFDIYEYDRENDSYTNLTNTIGYDAEGSYSPDGNLIAFTSNRQAYEGKLSEEEKRNFEIDPAYLNEIYLMNADGSDVRRLTTEPGYDGGPFFSPDGQRICWRRFTPNGAIAEVWTMKVDGSDQRQLTRIGSMSWAPFYHPSGEYLVFTTNKHGFANFELYVIDAEGKSPPARVTYTKGFDGLPVFTPDGDRIAWTSNRTASNQSQIFIADWDHERARALLGLDAVASSSDITSQDAREVAAAAQEQASAGFNPQDILRHVGYLCREELAGRLTGTRGEELATAYVAAYMDSLGLEPAGEDGTWFQPFEFTSGVALGESNKLLVGDRQFEVDKDWRPLSFSGTGEFAAAPVVFAGYGMHAPKSEEHEEYDSFVHLDVQDKWVMVFRYMPEDISPEQRQHLARAAQLRFKATVARDHGARGLIVVTGPNAKASSQLVPLQLDGMLAGTSLPVISVTDEVAQSWLEANGKSLKDLQDKLDSGALAMGFELEDVRIAVTIDVKRVRSSGRNVLGRLPAGDKPSAQIVVVGAHIDHLGKGASSSSLAREDEQTMIHYGADDNASGVAAMLEIAEYLKDQQASGKLDLGRDILFAAWSGEELGLIGSDHFVKTYAPRAGGAAARGTPPGLSNNASDPRATGHGHAGGSLYPSIAAYLNMDMVGRLEKKLVLQGIGSSSLWRSEIEQRNIPVGLPITLQEDAYLPTDAASFYMQGVPVLSAFTGSHGEYHTPRDTPDRLNYEGTASIAKLMALITRSLATRESPPDFIQHEAEPQETRAQLRAYLGTIPDYAEEVQGVLLGGASKGGPADKAGVKPGDIIVELAGKKIENIYDYTHAIEALKIGEKVKMVVERNDQRLTLEITPGSRE